MSILQHKFKILTLLFFAAGALVFAGGDHEFDPHKRADKIVARMEKELSLSKDQKVKVSKLAHEVAEQFKNAHQEGTGMHGGFAKQLRLATVDTSALHREMNEHASRAKQRHAFLIVKFAELHAILTPEQREKLAKHLEKRHEKMREHWEHGGW